VLAQRAVSEEQEGSSQTILLARRTRTIKLCSSDARSEGQSGRSPGGEVGKIGRPSPGLMARLGVPVGGRVRKLRAVWDSSGSSWGQRTRASLQVSSLVARCGLARNKTRPRAKSLSWQTQGWAGEVAAGVGRVRSLAFFSILLSLIPTNSSKEILGRRSHLRPGRGELLFGKTDQLLKPRGILDRHIG